MQLIILGAPGAGKGTLAQNINKYREFSHISTGDLFRKNIKCKTELGRLASQYIEKGQLVPDEVTADLISDELKQVSEDFILDGYPRNLVQAEILDRILNDLNIHLTACVYLDIDPEVVVRRLENRVVCPDCGATYNLVLAKTKKEGICDQCGGELIHRPDDNKETIEKRFQIYEKETKPLIQYYEAKGKLMTVNCNEGVLTKLDQLWEELVLKEHEQ